MSTSGVPTWSIQEPNVAHDQRIFVSGSTGSRFTRGMSSPGPQSFEDCVRDHSGALVSSLSERLFRPSVVLFPFLFATLVPLRTLELGILLNF